MYNPKQHSVSLNTGHKYVVPKIYTNGKFIPINIFIYGEFGDLYDSNNNYLVDSNGLILSVESDPMESPYVGVGVVDYMIVD